MEHVDDAILHFKLPLLIMLFMSLFVLSALAKTTFNGDHPDTLQQVVIGNMLNPALLHSHT